jgi:hypothetical protein
MVNSTSEPVDANSYCNITIRHWNGTGMEYDLQGASMTNLRTGWYYYNYHIDENADLGTYGVLVEADPEDVDTHATSGFHVSEWIVTLKQINATIGNIWERFERVNGSVIKSETVNSWVLNSTSSMLIEYNITIPLKEGYTSEDYLPVRWNYWFIDSNGNCVNQRKESYGVTPYCNPLVAQSLGKGDSSLVVNVTLRPALPVGNYSVIRELEVDPNQIWISYGRGPLGVVRVSEGVSNARVSIERIDFGEVRVTEVTTTTTQRIVEEPIVTARIIAVDKSDVFPWAVVVPLVLVLSLIVFFRRGVKARTKKEEKWYER